MYADQHIHTSFSGDSDTQPEIQIEKAISLGMKEICITDHHDYDVISDINFNLNLPLYFSSLNEFIEKYKRDIIIHKGIELGYQHHISEYMQKLTEEYSFDFVIGSVHFINGLDPYYPEYFNKYGSSSYELYFKNVYDMVNDIDCYDSLGHLDYIVRYGREYGLKYSYSQYSDYIDEILKKVISVGKALECNTSALSKGMNEPNPCRDVFVRYKELGGELITIGSDAHSPEFLGGCFDTVGEMLKKCGFNYYFIYKERKPCAHKL